MMFAPSTVSQEPFLVPAAGSRTRTLNVYGGLIKPKVTGDETGGQFAIFEGIVEPGGGPPLHVHHNEDEMFFVLEGDFVFVIDGRRIQAKTGDFLFAPRNVPHIFQNAGRTPGRMLTTVVPAGLDAFFAEIDALPALPDPAEAVPIAARYGLELLGPPLSAQM